MIYLFRKRNGDIIGATDASASAMFKTPNNFVTYQPIYLGAVTKEAFDQTAKQSELDVPIVIEMMVMKDGQPTSVTLDQYQINDLIRAGDQSMESRLDALLKKRAARHQELIAQLASTADRTKVPPDYSYRLGGVTDAVGDVSSVVKNFKHERA